MVVPDEKTLEIATSVIIHAGNARGLVNDALEKAEKGDIPSAESKISQAGEEIRSAHRIQMEMIQAEARGESMEFSIILVHAQDTLMVAMSEVNMAKRLINLYMKLQKEQ